MSGWWNAFRENLQFISQPVLLKTLPLVWTLHLCHGVYYLWKHVIWKGWVQMLGFIQLSKLGFSCPWHKHCVTLHTHNCLDMTKESYIRPYEWYQWQLYSHYGLHLLISRQSWCKQKKELALSNHQPNQQFRTIL
jgi:hypothetical protein